jgi:hypothetical protein
LQKIASEMVTFPRDAAPQGNRYRVRGKKQWLPGSGTCSAENHYPGNATGTPVVNPLDSLSGTRHCNCNKAKFPGQIANIQVM